MNLIIVGSGATCRMRSGMSSRNCLGKSCGNRSRTSAAKSAEVPRRVASVRFHEYVDEHHEYIVEHEHVVDYEHVAVNEHDWRHEHEYELNIQL